MKRAVIYARVSTVRQAEDGISIDSQIEQCRGKAAALGAEVAEVFRDEGRSGRTDRRPGFQAALAHCAANRIQYFICWSTSRFGRNLEDALKNANQLRDWGTLPAYVHQDIDLATDQGWMLGVMTGMMDEMHSRNVARDTLRSMISASREGWWVGGRAPFGYRPEKVGKRHRLVPHEINADIVRTAFRIAAEEGLGSQMIAARLNNEGLLRDGKRWGKSSVTLLLNNRSYMGLRMFNQVHHRSRLRKSAEEVVQVPSHPPLVSSEDFEKVQIMMKDRTPYEPTETGGTPRSTFAFSGLVACSICGEPMQIVNGTGRNGTMYSYYKCLGHKLGKAKCLMKPLRADKFDDWMVGEILDKVLTPEVAAKVIDEVKSKGGSWAQERDVRRRQLVASLRDSETRRGKLFEVIELQGKGTPALESMMQRLQALSNAIEATEADLRELEMRTPPDYKNVDLDPHEAAAAIRRLISQTGDKALLRGLLGTFVLKVAVNVNAAVVEYREDALLRNPTPTVHSGIRWLLNLGSNQGPTD